MEKLICIQKMIAVGDYVGGYVVIDEYGLIRNIGRHRLIELVREGKAVVENLKLVYSNKIKEEEFVDTFQRDLTNSIELDYTILVKLELTEKTQRLSFKKVNDLDSYINKALLLNLDIKQYNEHLTILESKTDIILVSDLDIVLADSYTGYGTFYEAQFNTIDFRNLKTAGVKYLNKAFYSCKIDYLDLTSFDTSKVLNMESMFQFAKIKKLIMNNINTDSLVIARSMFKRSKIDSLEINNIGRNKALKHNMFTGSDIKEIIGDTTGLDLDTKEPISPVVLR